MKFSIITAVYNRANYISQAVHSVQQQSYSDIEHIIVDGASTDGTLDILKKCLNEQAVLISESDNGIYDALNKGLLLASGEVIGFLHADDLYASHDVLSDVAKIFSDPDVCAVYGDLNYVSQIDTTKVIRRWISKPFHISYLNWGWMPAHPTLFVRREWYSEIDGFDTEYLISADYLSILRLFSNPDFKSIYLSKVLVLMRVGGASNNSLRAIIEKSKEDWRALRKSKFTFTNSIRALFWKNLSKLIQFF